MRHALWVWLLAVACLSMPPAAAAADPDPCRDFGSRLTSFEYAERIVGLACQESVLWHRPFIDDSGRFAGGRTMEAESALLADGVTPAWQRVATYWRHGRALSPTSGLPGAADCMAGATDWMRASSCRAFVLDRPWSAAFVSFVMARAGLPGFMLSASHADYVRAAYRHPDRGPFRAADPFATPATAGDLLCFVRRDDRAYGHAGLAAFFASGAGDGGLEMHCDIVVGNGGHLVLVGGNVMHGVTLRRLPLNSAGLPWNWPHRSGAAERCNPDAPAACNLNRQDWAVLLKLASLPAATAPMPALPTAAPPPPTCCTACVLGAVPAVPRCPGP
jgi:hypothetical protein